LHARDIVKTKGVDNVTVDDLVSDIAPKARAAVPDSIKRDLLKKVRAFMEEQKLA
jgi:enhancer of yellow 2 transcription factor